MPKVMGPVLSLDAQGSLGKKVTFQRRPSGSVIYPFAKPGSRVKKGALPSTAQKVIRDYYKEAVAKWKQLTPAQKKMWDDWVKQH